MTRGVVVHSRQTTWGGGEVLVAQIIEHLRARGTPAFLSAPDESILVARLDPGGDWYGLPGLVHVFNDFGSVWRCTPRMGRSHGRVFICHGWWQTSRLRNLACRILGVRVVAVSSSVRDAVLANGFLDRVDVLPVGPHESFHPPSADERVFARRQVGVAEDELVLVWVGRFQDVKRPEIFVRTVLALQESGPTRGIMVVPAEAQSPHERLVEAMVTRLEREHSCLTVLSGVEPHCAYHAADVMLSTSDFESLGLAMLEALACGLPVVTTAKGGPRDYIGEGGRMVSDQNPHEIALAVLAVAGRGRDRNRESALAAVAGRNTQAVVSVLVGG